MVKCGDIIELEIEKLTFQGAGLGRLRCDEGTAQNPGGLAVFVNGACPEDVLKVRVLKLNKNYATGKIVEILKPSPERIKPNCALSNVCGGCGWQFVNYDLQLSQKELILKEALYGLKSAPEIVTIPKTPQQWGFRHKVQYPIRETKVSKRLLAGYFKPDTHEIVNIKHCPIQPEIIDKIIDFIRQNWTLGAYVEKTNKGLLKNVLIRASSSGEGLLVTLVLNCEKTPFGVSDFAKKLMAEFKVITGILVNFNKNATNTILGEKFELLCGEDFIFETLKGKGDKKRYKIAADSFFQTNPKCAVQIFDTVKSLVNEGSSVLDAYGGVGAIGIWVGDKAKSIALVEENENAVKCAKENFKLNNIKGYEVFLGDAKVKFNDFYVKKRFFDHVILDPPRKGCEKGVLEIISKLVAENGSIIYVSCNPQTLARDIKTLETFGFECKKVQAFDMFPHTYHIESVALIEKRKP